MNNEANNILDNLGTNQLEGIGFNLVSLLKLPIIIILAGNVLFAALLFLRSRILSDTFESSKNSLIRAIVLIYLIATIIGSIIAILFLLIG